jgi:hypothetical protein
VPLWHLSHRLPRRTTLGVRGLGLTLLGAPMLLAACGGSSSASGSGASTTSAASCSGISGAHHARVVIESSKSSVLQRCVGFSTPTITATKLLSKAHVELGTQQYSFGLAVCQVNNVPAHYSACLPSGKPYWALFVSPNDSTWHSASTGVSQTIVHPGEAIGFRYDSPKGTPAVPAAPLKL